MKKYRRYRVKVSNPKCPDFIFYAPTKQMAIYYTEMCGFAVLNAKEEK